jgi:hypothetical protein
MRGVLSLALAAVAFGFSGVASAQTVVVDEPLRGDVRIYDLDRRERLREPRVYGYVRSADDDVVVMRPASRSGCGQFYYWNGLRCVDARDVPPDIR